MAKHSNQQQIYLIDIIGSKLLIESKTVAGSTDLMKTFPLGNDTKLSRSLDLNYGNPWEQLEVKLQKLTLSAKLGTSTIILGYRGDPLHPFKDRFDNTMKILKLLRKYQPKKLIIQTRSSLVVLALDALKALDKKVEINLQIETPRDDVALKITPNFPLPSERLKAGTALKNFGITVNTVLPFLLPYGNMQADADAFARTLSKFSKRIIFLPHNFITERSVVSTSLNNHYDKDWMKPDSNKHLINAINKISRSLLEEQHEEPAQLKLFVA